MRVPVETLMAYVDGELTPDERRRVEGEMAAHPDLKAYVDRQMALRRQITNAFDTVLDAPLPDHLVAAVSKPQPLVWRAVRSLKAMVARHALIWSGIPAATLACGVVLGMLIAAPGSGEIVFEHGALVARGDLSQTLSHALSGRPMKTASAGIGLSFRDKTGRYCRTFTTGGASPLAGVACHQGGDWHVAALAATAPEEGAGASYALAGSAMPDAVRSAVRAMIAGAPLDAAGEKKARAGGWGHN